MRKSDVHEARVELHRSNAEFERSLDELQGVLENRADQLQDLRSKAKQTAESLRNPRELVDRITDRAKLKQMLDEKRTQAESFVQERVRDVQRTADEALRDSIENARAVSHDFVEDMRSSLERGLQSLDSRPIRTWVSVFMSGLVLGIYLSRRRSVSRENVYEIKGGEHNITGGEPVVPPPFRRAA